MNARFVKPIDEEMLEKLAQKHGIFVALEENVASGGYGEKVREYVDTHHLPVQVISIALPDDYVEHGNVDILKNEVGIGNEQIVKRIISANVGCKKED